MERTTRRAAAIAGHLLPIRTQASTEIAVDPREVETSVSGKDLAVEVSNRHIHLTNQDIEDLFGKGYELTPVRGLVGFPLEIAAIAGFAAKETLNIVNPESGKVIERVRILGPPRPATQIELAYTDCRFLKLEAPTRISGDTKRSGACQLVAENGKTLDVREGVIRAWRHVHLTQIQSERVGVKTGDLMAVKVTTPMCSLTLHDVMVRVYPPPEIMVEAWKLLAGLQVELPMEVHLDTDEGNAAMIQDATSLELYRVDPQTKKQHIVAKSSVENAATEWAVEQMEKRSKRQLQLASEVEPRQGGVFYDEVNSTTSANPPTSS
jgi:propanediol utilization protein